MFSPVVTVPREWSLSPDCPRITRVLRTFHTFDFHILTPSKSTLRLWPLFCSLNQAIHIKSTNKYLGKILEQCKTDWSQGRIRTLIARSKRARLKTIQGACEG